MRLTFVSAKIRRKGKNDTQQKKLLTFGKEIEIKLNIRQKEKNKSIEEM